MITQVRYSIRSAREEDRGQLAPLIQLEPYVHRHLDWRAPLDWLGHEPFLVAERNQSLVAVLACPTDPPGVSWIRTFAAAGYAPTSRLWQDLWETARDYLSARQIYCAAALPLYRWFRKLLEASDFEMTHRVIVLTWENTQLPNAGPKPPAVIRAMREEDLTAVTKVDHAAFRTIWKNSRATLELAFQQSVCATVAEDESGIIGYQISTPSPYGWHLARLAINPRGQRQGIAYALVHDLLAQSIRQGEIQVSVNTQHDNHASLELYRKIGFRPTGEEYPVYQYFLE